MESVSKDPYGTVVDASCLDTDAQGTPLSVIWEQELDSKVLTTQAWEKLGAKGFDEPDEFSVFFNTLRWHCVTSTDPAILQSPFRAGIRLDAYQLEPLAKALRLPRVNMFIADDVGLGKTIEAGLIASELLLRRRIKNIVITCPPSMLGQWKDEMETRFGLTFEILDRAYLESVRRKRGYGVNPWSTYPRFLVSNRLLIDETYAGPLRTWLDTFKSGTLLIFDEAHHAAPASNSKLYAIDSKQTRAIRDLSARFEHRLFLSATPHNGHSNSFSALLEILDPNRFTRGVDIVKSNLDDIMVRRLKEDIREVAGGFPKREIVAEIIDDLPDAAAELVLAELLDAYEATITDSLKDSTAGKRSQFKLVFSNLQQRLFSSVDAFARTLAKHRESFEKALQGSLDTSEKSKGSKKTSWQAEHLLKHGIDREDDLAAEDDAAEEALADAMAEASASVASELPIKKPDALELLDQMRDTAEAGRYLPDARIVRFIEWMREHMCSGVGVPNQSKAKKNAPWTAARVIIFTEYVDTLRYIRQQLTTAIDGTELADQRIEVFQGATSPERREAIKLAFNADPDTHPVRILLANDAAREGLNLQAHCNNLFHFDVPWNPSKLEQRNGRIDRKLQPAEVVYCHYFRYAQRPEDRILEALVTKTETIKQELGSLSQILDRRVKTSLKKSGISRRDIDKKEKEIEDEDLDEATKQTMADELEASRERGEKLAERIKQLERQLANSRKALHFKTSVFQNALSQSLELAGFAEFSPATNKAGRTVYEFPVDLSGQNVDPSWAVTLDALRAPPKDGKRNAIWRKEAPIRPVTFEPPETFDDTNVQLHLGHRVSQRLLSRFLSQGFIHDDLSRACFGQATDKVSRVILIGRLGLYGPRASRLHEKIVFVAAPWHPPEGRKPLEPYKKDTATKTEEMLNAAMANPETNPLDPAVQQQLLDSMPQDIEELLPHLETAGNEAKEAAIKRLQDRARIESEDLVKVLQLQKKRVERSLAAVDDKQDLLSLEGSAEEKRQREENVKYWRKWLEGVDADIEEEPVRIQKFYEVHTTRLDPVGLIYLQPLETTNA